MRAKIKPPAESKSQLMAQILEMLQRKWPVDPRAAIEFSLSFYTSADLVGIRDELRRGGG